MRTTGICTQDSLLSPLLHWMIRVRVVFRYTKHQSTLASALRHFSIKVQTLQACRSTHIGLRKTMYQILRQLDQKRVLTLMRSMAVGPNAAPNMVVIQDSQQSQPFANCLGIRIENMQQKVPVAGSQVPLPIVAPRAHQDYSSPHAVVPCKAAKVGHDGAFIDQSAAGSAGGHPVSSLPHRSSVQQ